MLKQPSARGSASPQTTCLGAPADWGQGPQDGFPRVTACDAIREAPGGRTSVSPRWRKSILRAGIMTPAASVLTEKLERSRGLWKPPPALITTLLVAALSRSSSLRSGPFMASSQTPCGQHLRASPGHGIIIRATEAPVQHARPLRGQEGGPDNSLPHRALLNDSLLLRSRLVRNARLPPTPCQTVGSHPPTRPGFLDVQPPAGILTAQDDAQHPSGKRGRLTPTCPPAEGVQTAEAPGASGPFTPGRSTHPPSPT